VRADAGQIEQLLMNLVVNARDAMPDGGTLAIDIQDVEMDEIAKSAGAPRGPYVLLKVSDTGTGMDEAARQRIFEPFFTTKPPGKGTGLGLATVYGVVKQSGGHVAVDSTPGRGTTFKIYLPRLEEAAQTTSTMSAAAATGAETILVVEDEDDVRHMATRMLTSAGFTVLPARSADEALRLIALHEHQIHLMLTDMVMPTMSGPDLAARLATSRPEIKVLYTSGYTDDAFLHRAVSEDATDFIGKPYTKAELTRKVRETLDSPSNEQTP
jgi:two-component system cell cycle sensor histidine kinase/response regulator CckA